jgi:hypothetical protein
MMKRLSIWTMCVVFAVVGCSRPAERKGPEGAMVLDHGAAGAPGLAPSAVSTMLLDQGGERVLAVPGPGAGQTIFMKISEVQTCEQTASGWVCTMTQPTEACPGCAVVSCNCARRECASMCRVANHMKMFSTPGPL